MTIQGMSQGLAYSSMSYYMNDGGLPVFSECSENIISGEAGIGLYKSTFSMTGGIGDTGAVIIVFEVGDVKQDDDGTNAVQYPLGDKLRWEYNGTYGSEYSAVHMGDADGTGNADVMHGTGYMRGLIGSAIQASENNTGNTAFVQPAIPMSVETGSRLLGDSDGNMVTFAFDPTTGNTTISAPTLPTTDHRFGQSAQNEITTGGKEYEYLDQGQAGNATLPDGTTPPHGTFKDIDQYLWAGGAFSQTGSILNDALGPYTGHNQVEIADWEQKTYVGSSTVSLSDNDVPYATRQAMMVVPVTAGGQINIAIEAPMHGTWHRHMCFCPVELPKWGRGDDKAGTLANGTPYLNAAAALNHNFSDPTSPTSGSVEGANTTLFHVNSQNRVYRQEGYFSTQTDGGHIISALNVDSAGATAGANTISTADGSWAGVVNQFDWVFTDNGGANKVPIGFYAIEIGSTVYAVDVGDTDVNSVAKAGVVANVTA